MKKRILLLTLVLMIVLSSFSISFADPGSFNISPIPSNATAGSIQKYNNAIQLFASECDYVLAFDNGGLCYIVGTNIEDTTEKAHIRNNGEYNYLSNSTEGNYYHSQYVLVNWASDSTSISVNYTGKVQTLVKNYYYSNFAIYGLDYININNPGTQINDYVNPIQTVSIKPSQRILFNYTAADKDKFLKSLSCTPDKSITVHQGYYSGGQVTDLVIKKDTTDLLIGGAPLTLASFPSHRALNTNEYLGYSQANGGNWVWTDFIPGSFGGPVGTDSNSLVTFTVDTRYCSYRVVSANTGLEITSGGIADVPQIPDDGIYNNNQNPWGPGDITDDYLLDRADYEDGIIGDIQYGFDTLFKFLKMPFELLYKFIMTLGEIIQYALGTVSGLTTALQGIYAILPAPIWFLVIMAISINVFKLIFGR